MFFTNSIFLIGLAFATIPLIIHLFFKSKIKEVVFSSNMFLSEILKNESRSIKLQEILILLLRTLIIIFLILSISHPVIKIKSNNKNLLVSTKSKSIVFVFDNSYSMGIISNGESLLSQAKKIALNFLDLDKNKLDNFAIIATSDLYREKVYNLTYNKKFLINKINNIRISYLKNNVFESFKDAVDILNNSNNKIKLIYFFTDLQKNIFKNEDNEFINKFVKIKYPIMVVTLHNRDGKNSAIVNTTFSPVLHFKSDNMNFQQSIVNFSKKKNNLIIKFHIKDNPVAQKSISLPPHNNINVNFNIKLEDSGFYYGFSDIIDGDDLKYDNKNYFLFYVPEKISIDAIEDDDNLFYVNSAINPISMLDSNMRTPLKIYSLEDINKNSKSDIILISKNNYTLSDAKKIKSLLLKGKNLILFAGNSFDFNSFNENIIKRNLFVGSLITERYDKKGMKIGFLDYTHPVLNIFKEIKPFKKTVIYKYYKINLMGKVSDVNILARLDNNDPLIVEYKPYFDKKVFDKTGRIILFLFTPIPDMSTIIYNPNFPPLIQQLIRYMAGNIDIKLLNSFKTGVSINDVAAILSLPQNNLAIQPILPHNIEISYDTIVSPGIYKISNKYIAVNLDFNESDLSYIKLNDLKKVYKGISFLDSGIKGLNGDIFVSNGEGYYPLWKLFLIISLILLIIEIFIANKVRILTNKSESKT